MEKEEEGLRGHGGSEDQRQTNEDKKGRRGKSGRIPMILLTTLV
jgi:hypothetical protein